MTTELMNLINLVFKLGDWVNTITNFHIVMNLAVIGWLFSAKKPWSQLQKIIVIIIFAAFAFYNDIAQYETHRWLEVASNELRAAAAQDTKAVFYTAEFKSLLQEKHSYSPWAIACGYALADIFICVLIWFSYLWKKDEEAA